MKTVIITGSTRGIGFGLARNFLLNHWNVVINGRAKESVQEAVKKLALEIPSCKSQLAALAGDVTKSEDMEKLWNIGKERFKSVDVWINNAGIGHPLQMIFELPRPTIDNVINIDIIGMLNGCRSAIRGMLKQGHGHIYNMEGFGSNGMIRPGLSVYGAAKRALRYLTRALHQELKNTAVKVSALSPGMVATDFITGQYENNPQGLEEAKRIFNILGDKVETVTPWLVKKVIRNQKSGQNFQWLTGKKIFWRFLTSGFNKRNIFTDS